MRKEWMKIVPQIIDNLSNIKQVQCPRCGKYGIEYLYVGDEKTRVGYLQVWCNECLKGIHISRAIAPVNARFASFDDDLSGIVPVYELDE